MNKQTVLTLMLFVSILVSAIAFCAMTGAGGDPARQLWTALADGGKLPYEDPRYVYAVAEAHYRNKEYAMAQDVSRRVLILDSSSIPAYKLLTAIYLQEGKPEEALLVCREAVRLNPRDGLSQIALGTIYQKLGRINEAKTVFQAIREDSTLSSTVQTEATVHLAELDSALTAGKAERPPAP